MRVSGSLKPVESIGAKMKKILIVITTAFFPYGGLSTVMLNYYRAMEKDGFCIDFASTNEPDKELLNELKANGSRYFNLGDRKKKLLKFMGALADVLEKGKYDVVHVNGNSSTMAVELCLAKRAGIPMRIAHLHTTKSNYPILNKLLQPVFRGSYTHAIAVSEQAGKWLYGSNYIVLNNAINTFHYQYDKEAREKFRQLYGLKDKFVVGNVGKLNYPKNQIFLLKVFEVFHRKNLDSVLVIAGGGELEKQLREEAKKRKIEDAVLFLGMCNDVREALQGFDVFVFPSLFEGLGLAVIEAQASGLKCIASDVLPIETRVSENIRYLSLDKPVEEWADEIEKIYHSTFDRNGESEKACESICERGFDIFYEAEKLADIYHGKA